MGDSEVEVARAETSHRRRTGGARRNRLGGGERCGLGEPARQRSPTRNRPVASWNGSAARRGGLRGRSFGIPCGRGGSAGWVCGRSVGYDWCGSVRGVMWGRGSVARAGSRAAARSGTQRAGGGKGFCSSHGGRGGQVSAPRHGHVGRVAGFRRSAFAPRTHRGDVFSWTPVAAKPRGESRVGLNRPVRRGRRGRVGISFCS